ncbi:MAG: zinc ribbon domain-containing protein [Deltaproteobacteria bacterium]|nr:zinc ribbon domain-containing protein [Candidatus Anaeroferrophillus wilburensis]MBN2888771.1 zinc ribbon domain-containing protein [Deltaproteobacteria bacterium]
MPTYEYRCRNCGFTFEVSQKMSDVKLTTCERCEGELERLISGGTGFIAGGGTRGTAERPACGMERPCCGRDQVCGERACHHES